MKHNNRWVGSIEELQIFLLENLSLEILSYVSIQYPIGLNSYFVLCNFYLHSLCNKWIKLEKCKTNYKFHTKNIPISHKKNGFVLKILKKKKITLYQTIIFIRILFFVLSLMNNFFVFVFLFLVNSCVEKNSWTWNILPAPDNHL